MASIDIGELMATVDPPMVVVTAAADGDRSGCLVGFHSQASIDPIRYAVWLSPANHTYRIGRRASVLGVHFLDRDDRARAELFGGETGDEIDKLAHCDHELGPDDVPLLIGCPARFVLRVTAIHTSDTDHVCFVGEPESMRSSAPFEPLRLSDTIDIDAGHERE